MAVTPLPTVGLGAIPPTRDMLLQAGVTDPSNTTLGCLQQLVQIMATIQNRIAPQPLLLPIDLTGLAVGEQTPANNTNNPTFNGFLVTLTKGTVRVYIGGPTRGQGFMDLPSNPIPYHVFFAQQANNQLTFKNIDPANTCQGTVYVMSY